MSEPRSRDLVETPGERADARDVAEARAPVPTDDATPTAASAAGVHMGTVAEGVAAEPPPVTEPLAPTAGEHGPDHGPGSHAGDGSAGNGSAGNGSAGNESAGSTGEVEVECPGCEQVVVGESPRPTAAWFCPGCDYPLFWAAPPAPDLGAQKRARRRLPGTGGATVLGATACWSCGEMNEPGSTGCIRCAATLPRPKAAEAPPRIVEVTKPVLVPQPYRIPTATWPFVAAGALAGAALAASTTVWILRLAGLLGAGAAEPVTVLQTTATLLGGG